MALNISNISNVVFHARSISTSNGHSAARFRLGVHDGEGNAAKEIKTVFGNGNEITRKQVRTVNEDGSISVQGNINSKRGETTFTGKVSDDKQSAELTFVGPNGGTKSFSFTRDISTLPEPNPVVEPPVEEPLPAVSINVLA